MSRAAAEGSLSLGWVSVGRQTTEREAGSILGDVLIATEADRISLTTTNPDLPDEVIRSTAMRFLS